MGNFHFHSVGMLTKFIVPFVYEQMQLIALYECSLIPYKKIHIRLYEQAIEMLYFFSF